jgi:hypothetical protein
MRVPTRITARAWVGVRYGATRAAIEAAAFQCRSGGWYGDSHFDESGLYAIDNQQGEYGLIRFLSKKLCVGAFLSVIPGGRTTPMKRCVRSPRSFSPS